MARTKQRPRYATCALCMKPSRNRVPYYADRPLLTIVAIVTMRAVYVRAIKSIRRFWFQRARRMSLAIRKLLKSFQALCPLRKPRIRLHVRPRHRRRNCAFADGKKSCRRTRRSLRSPTMRPARKKKAKNGNLISRMWMETIIL